MSTVDLIIFDCDGVLIDSEVVGATALAEAITDAGLPMSAQAVELMFSGAGRAETRALIERLGLDAVTVITDADARMSALFAQGVPPVQVAPAAGFSERSGVRGVQQRCGSSEPEPWAHAASCLFRAAYLQRRPCPSQQTRAGSGVALSGADENHR